ncbi:MAG: lytic transglycosylase domain-containing protein [Deltaproteobacteria bacterium]|nr:lytic transglycosylase domain-containing protein [Deltaproteobacteria bacterium]
MSFKTALDEASVSAANSSSIAKTFVSDTHLAESLKKIQIQMNRHLMDAMSLEKKGELEDDHSFLMHHLLISRLNLPSDHPSNQNPTIPGTNSSNIMQSNQNNDVFNVPKDLEDIINQAALMHGVDSALIKSVIKVESDFNPDSTSPKGAMGLMQLMPATAKDLGVQNAHDPAENVQAGTRYLRTLLDRYGGNADMALAAYNWGMGNLERKPDGMPAETRNYVKNVNHYYERMKV